ncbi:unnamed protein product [Phytophthora lilii]|uniref:Unnamed protein product n=1 Tax=Phytophthora lilii TaxID=2077276 RepID=A0A9W6TQZ3_9STRA|nr:unnamed protein product [Phytophthora lilii]
MLRRRPKFGQNGAAPPSFALALCIHFCHVVKTLTGHDDLTVHCRLPPALGCYESELLAAPRYFAAAAASVADRVPRMIFIDLDWYDGVKLCRVVEVVITVSASMTVPGYWKSYVCAAMYGHYNAQSRTLIMPSYVHLSTKENSEGGASSFQPSAARPVNIPRLQRSSTSTPLESTFVLVAQQHRIVDSSHIPNGARITSNDIISIASSSAPILSTLDFRWQEGEK